MGHSNNQQEQPLSAEWFVRLSELCSIFLGHLNDGLNDVAHIPPYVNTISDSPIEHLHPQEIRLSLIAICSVIGFETNFSVTEYDEENYIVAITHFYRTDSALLSTSAASKILEGQAECFFYEESGYFGHTLALPYSHFNPNLELPEPGQDRQLLQNQIDDLLRIIRVPHVKILYMFKPHYMRFYFLPRTPT